MTQKQASSYLWKPDRRFIESSTLKRYMDWLFVKKGLYIRDYDDLWDWSVTDLEDFWESIYQFFDIQSHSAYRDVLDRNPDGMIGTEWFTGATVNYAEHAFRFKNKQHPAILFHSERSVASDLRPTAISWTQLEEEVAAVAAYLRSVNVGPGDRVVSVLPNIPEAVVAFLATNAVGAIWSSCSPDFGTSSILDRFQQIEPKVLFAVDGYTYNGKPIEKISAFRELRQHLPTLEKVVWLPYLNPDSRLEWSINWDEVLNTPHTGLEFTPVPFSHPLWVLYSSGTTGKPKAITHSVGGCLIEHLKTLALHQDVKPGERYFWYSTTGWMMWNFSVASLLVGATLVLYDGSAAYPDMNVLWDLADQLKINHFGGGAAYYLAAMRAGLEPAKTHSLNALRSIGSTGSPLPNEGFEWIYQSVKKDVWLISFSGGTDICSGFVGGCPLLPVYPGEIQRRLLGCKLEAFDETGNPVRESLGEMVILAPMPSMPVFFWNDTDNRRYTDSYFGNFGPHVWRHGDFIKITGHNGVIIYGRSDATLNRDGVRIGTAEIYSAVEQLPEIADSLVIGIEKENGGYAMPLFVVLKANQDLDSTLVDQIKKTLRIQCSPRHVPDAVFAVREIPYTISGKKMEMPVKKILSGLDPSLVAAKDTMRNPDALDYFVPFQDKV
ncbi:acetoacetate--CoA ligase [Arsenicibacter rosenii]|uniref:Acetoacetate--CoA ligase n=1 Tax=Arsenicibacter rosenii TaxID=1750698 RepID=A0A1S2VMN6_9BACT|nr:acetoacetate--CoA ligase [Arsenicibacter rosenii]OIN60032.1 acetoacetate--CoA ligase [Arsenicibacter rosenii]